MGSANFTHFMIYEHYDLPSELSYGSINCPFNSFSKYRCYSFHEFLSFLLPQKLFVAFIM